MLGIWLLLPLCRLNRLNISNDRDFGEMIISSFLRAFLTIFGKSFDKKSSTFFVSWANAKCLKLECYMK